MYWFVNMIYTGIPWKSRGQPFTCNKPCVEHACRTCQNSLHARWFVNMTSSCSKPWELRGLYAHVQLAIRARHALYLLVSMIYTSIFTQWALMIMRTARFAYSEMRARYTCFTCQAQTCACITMQIWQRYSQYVESQEDSTFTCN